MSTFDIYINGKWFGNVTAKNLTDAESAARLLILQSNPKILATKFQLAQRVVPQEFNI